MHIFRSAKVLDFTFTFFFLLACTYFLGELHKFFLYIKVFEAKVSRAKSENTFFFLYVSKLSSNDFRPVTAQWHRRRSQI